MMGLDVPSRSFYPGLMSAKIDQIEARKWGRALANLRERSSVSQDMAAQNFGVGSGAAWGKYEQGKAPSIFRPDTQRRLVAALGATIEELHLEKVKLADPATTSPGGSHVAERPRRHFEAAGPNPGMAAVYGMAAALPDAVAISPGSEIRFVPIHPAQRGYTRVGAIEVVGESMYPRWKPRELAYFVFDLPGARGDDVVVALDDGTAILKEYLGRTSTNLMLKEWHPAERAFEVPLDRVRAVHAVVG